MIIQKQPDHTLLARFILIHFENDTPPGALCLSRIFCNFVLQAIMMLVLSTSPRLSLLAVGAFSSASTAQLPAWN